MQGLNMGVELVNVANHLYVHSEPP